MDGPFQAFEKFLWFDFQGCADLEHYDVLDGDREPRKDGIERGVHVI